PSACPAERAWRRGIQRLRSPVRWDSPPARPLPWAFPIAGAGLAGPPGPPPGRLGGVPAAGGLGRGGTAPKGLGFGGAARGVCCRGCAGGWPAGGCWAGVWANIAGQMEMTQKQTGITTRRRRLKSFMRAYLSTLRGYDDVETQATVSLLQLRFQRWSAIILADL